MSAFRASLMVACAMAASTAIGVGMQDQSANRVKPDGIGNTDAAKKEVGQSFDRRVAGLDISTVLNPNVNSRAGLSPDVHTVNPVARPPVNDPTWWENNGQGLQPSMGVPAPAPGGANDKAMSALHDRGESNAAGGKPSTYNMPRTFQSANAGRRQAAASAPPRDGVDPNYAPAGSVSMESSSGTSIACVCSGTYDVGQRVQLIIDDPSGNPLLVPGALGSAVCGESGGWILISWDGLSNGHNGNGICSCPGGAAAPGTTGWYVPCANISAIECVCAEYFEPGVTVYATVDNPDGNPDIVKGQPGTVVCGDVFLGGENDLILVDWGFAITNGHNGFGSCDCPQGAFAPDGQGWYVFCSEITLTAPPATCVCEEEFVAGELVYATVDYPDGNPNIVEGMAGTVVCGRFFGGGDDDLILVNWGFNVAGHDGFGACSCPVEGATPAEFGWYMRCHELSRIDAPATCVCEEQFVTGQTVYATVDAPDGNNAIKKGDTGTVVCGRFFGSPDDLILVEWNIANGHNGFGACSCPTDGATQPNRGWYVFCDQITGTAPLCFCGDEPWFPGETVYAESDFENNGQIFPGSSGTVVCASDHFGELLLVEWNINNGHDGFGDCNCPIGAAATSPKGWYFPCELIQDNPPILCSDCAGEFGVGDVVWARKSNPQSNADIQRGWRGVVVCGTDFGFPSLLVQWDNLTTGHNGNGFCDCPNGATSLPGTGWYIDCQDVSRSPIPCPGDTNHDNFINVTDLLALLAAWGPCAGCLTDMNGDDMVNVTDLLILLAEWGNC